MLLRAPEPGWKAAADPALLSRPQPATGAPSLSQYSGLPPTSSSLVLQALNSPYGFSCMTAPASPCLHFGGEELVTTFPSDASVGAALPWAAVLAHPSSS